MAGTSSSAGLISWTYSTYDKESGEWTCRKVKYVQLIKPADDEVPAMQHPGADV